MSNKICIVTISVLLVLQTRRSGCGFQLKMLFEIADEFSTKNTPHARIHTQPFTLKLKVTVKREVKLVNLRCARKGFKL